MICEENIHKIAKCVLLGLLCLDSVFSATIETTAWKLGDGEVEGIFGEYEDEGNDSNDGDILHLDFFRFTTRKRYIWEDWDRPESTRDYGDYGGSTSSTNVVLYVIVPICVAGIVGTLLYYCIKHLGENNCYSTQSDSYSSISADRFTTVHRPPERREVTPAQVHRPLTWRTHGHGDVSDATGAINTFLNSTNASSTQGDPRREPAVRDLFGELDGNVGASHSTGVINNFPDAGSNRGRRATDNAVSENPPDYSTVTLNDLVNPTQPAFPVVKKENETPPPEYGKQNPFL